MAQRFSFDDTYKIYAWRDNNIKLVLTQGEGLADNVSSYSNTYVKTAKFQLRDEQGIISIPSDTVATLALKKRNGEEALIEMFTSYTSSSTTLSNDKSNGIVTFAIKRSMTDVSGEMKGEIRLTTSTGIIKFFGICFYVYDGVSNAAAERSEAFSALVAQTNKVEALLENADSFGNLTNLDDTIAHGGTHPTTSGVIYDYLVNNYVPKTTQIAGLDIQDGIIASELRTALNVPQVYERTRRPDDADGERIGQFWVAKLTDSTTNKITYEIYQLYEYYTDESAPTVVHRRWKKICDIDQVVSKDTQIAGVEIQDGIELSDLLTAILGTNVTATQNKPVAGRILFQYLLNNYVRFATTIDPDSAKDGHTLYIDGTQGNDLIFVVPTNSKITQYRISADGTIKSRYCTATGGVQTSAWQNWAELVSTNNIQDGAITFDKLNSNIKDTSPVQNSDRLITSGGVYQALQDYLTSQYNNQNFRKYQGINSEDVDLAVDQQTLYTVYYQGLYSILYCVSGTSNRVQYLHKSTGAVLYRYQNKSNDVWGDWDDWKLISTQHYKRRSSIPSTNSSGNLWDVCWYNDGSKEHCYQLTSIGGTAENPVYNWTEIVSKTVLDATIDALTMAINNKIVVFSYTLSRNSWSNNQQSVSVPSGYAVTGDVMADTEIGSTAYNQLCADGCGGIYITSTTSNNTLTLTAHALGNAPTADVTIQVTLTAVTDLTE